MHDYSVLRGPVGPGQYPLAHQPQANPFFAPPAVQYGVTRPRPGYEVRENPFFAPPAVNYSVTRPRPGQRINPAFEGWEENPVAYSVGGRGPVATEAWAPRRGGSADFVPPWEQQNPSFMPVPYPPLQSALMRNPWEEEIEAESPECPQCGGPGVFMGQLGSLAHFRCRNCGWDFPIRTQGDYRGPLQENPPHDMWSFRPGASSFQNPGLGYAYDPRNVDTLMNPPLPPWATPAAVGFATGMAFGPNAVPRWVPPATAGFASGLIFGPNARSAFGFNPGLPPWATPAAAGFATGVAFGPGVRSAFGFNPRSPHPRCRQGLHLWDRSGFCKRCDAQLERTRGMFGFDPSAETETWRREEATGQGEFFHGEERNPRTLEASAEAWARSRGLMVPPRGSPAWRGLYAAWTRQGMQQENPGRSHGHWTTKGGKLGSQKRYSRGVIPSKVKKAPHVKKMWRGMKKHYTNLVKTLRRAGLSWDQVRRELGKFSPPAGRPSVASWGKRKAESVFYAKLRTVRFSPKTAKRLPKAEPARGRRRARVTKARGRRRRRVA